MSQPPPARGCTGNSRELAALAYLCSGVNAGMNFPDAADPSLQSIRVLE
ncbi:MAG TPA: hypothetical protein VFW69_16490 [Mycobacterium sp.]|nr:hypothetical protein [Mycobacterium sp.]